MQGRAQYGCDVYFFGNREQLGGGDATDIIIASLRRPGGRSHNRPTTTEYGILGSSNYW